MLSLIKMGCLPGFLLVLVLLPMSLGTDLELLSDSGKAAGQSPRCPGLCSEIGTCNTELSETDCPNDMICCVDHLEKITTTEFADVDFTTPNTLEEDGASENQEMQVFSEDESTEGVPLTTESLEEAESYSYGDEVEVENDGRYKIVYSEESGEAVLEPVEEPSSDCPGACVPLEFAEDCHYVIHESESCSSETVCCLTVDDVKRTSYMYDYVEENSDGIVKRAAEDQRAVSNCPGSCLHPSHAVYCDRILTSFYCPLDAICCLSGSNEKHSSEPTECTGQCLPFHMSGYCFPPNELVVGQTNCDRGKVCCMPNPGNVQPPLNRAMTFPSLPIPAKYDQGAQILGHLAVDDAGTVFKVSRNGQIYPLQRLPPMSNLQEFSRLATYPRFDGEIAIYSDMNGNLYQQFFPRQSAARGPQIKVQTPLIRQPVHQFESQASEHAGLQASIPQKDKFLESGDNGDTSDDIVIPDDDDDAPVSQSTPLSPNDKSSRPACPGSCMSYFLRFTCFRGYATYDGFTCPGRSVCCARLKDIEDHEQYLKSLSPYFNVPPASRDSSLPRCGIKGRRDTPRVMGGKDSLPGEWCWQVAVINVNNQYICGGALIDNSWVLTAAHCVAGQVQENQALFVRAGVTDLKSPEDNNKAQTVRVVTTFTHHNYNSVNLDNNVALLRLQKPIELGSNVCVICLPTSRKMPEDHVKCTVTGYGFVTPEGEMSLRIREAQVPLVDDMECMTNVTEALDNPFILPASSFCAGGEGIEDACQGDAGGALACEVGGFHELVGLVSWGLGCGREDVPSIYVKVPAFMGWINQIISSSSFLNSLV